MSKDPTSPKQETDLQQLLARIQRGELKPEAALRQLPGRQKAPEQEAAPSDPAQPWPPIAVIGMAGRFPGAPDLDGYWTNLVRGTVSVGPIPPERWSAEDYYHPDPRQPGKTPSRWGGFLDGIDRFDPLFFALSPREAELMDPQQRLFLLEAWRALEEAGYGDIPLDKQACGVFVGCGPSDYLPNLYRHGVAPDALAFTGNSNPILAARIAFLLNLRGPAIAVDTACSSSLVAVILACESIAAGTSDLALAGGVSVFTTPQTHLLSGQAGMLSPSGRCYTFDARADGFVPAEGVGVVVLKRLALALRDGDHVHGVIRACGLNQDGRSNGITAPSASSQTALIQGIYRRYGIDPQRIGLIEAHGTGTQLGDPIEVSALVDAYGPGAARDCVLGSVKANIGHASSAAGIAGLLKLLLCLKYKIRTPLAGFERLNPHIDLADSGFRLLAEAEGWPAVAGQPRLAALSSFGFSGTNAHLVISEAESSSQREREPERWRLYAVSGQDEAGFRRRCRDLAAWLDSHPDTDSADLSYTLLLGRTHGRHREAVVAADIAAFKAALQHWSNTASLATDAVPSSPHPTQIQTILDQARTLGPDALSRDELESLAAAYRAGIKPAWPEVFTGQPRRLSLPTYPFDLRRYWIPAELCGTLPPQWHAHPLLDSPNLAASTGNGLVLDKTIPAHWPLLADHRVQGCPVLPATAYLEMAFAAARMLVPGTTCAITDLVWPAPCRAEGEAVTLRLRLERDGADYRFEFESAAGCHGRGRLVASEAREAPPIDLAGFLKNCPETVDGSQVRAFYASRGLDYGPGFQGLKRLRLGDGQLAGWIALPPGTRRGEGVYWLDPALADAALQAAAWLFARPGAAPEGLLLPHRLAKAEWLRPLTARGMVCARASGPLTLDMVILDEQGQLAARLDGLVLAGSAGKISTYPALPPEAIAFLDTFDRLETWATARLWQVLAEHLPDGSFDLESWAEIQAIQPKYRRLLPVLLGLLADGGYVALRDDGTVVPLGRPVADGDALQAERFELCGTTPAIAPFARLIWDCTAALWPVLAGITEVTRILFPTGSAADVAGIYAGNPLADAYNQTLARLAAAFAAEGNSAEPFRILEIGGGTGSATMPLVAALENLGQPVEYHFSDLSPAFVRQAETRFPQAFVRCRVFDLESAADGSFDAPFDLVVAANVVHATRSIAGSLDRIQTLLAPGGILLLNEITARTVFGALTFGLTDGWWAFDETEQRLPGSPLLDGPGWERTLAAAGFEDVESFGGDWCSGHALDHRILVARAPLAVTANYRSHALRGKAAAKRNHQGFLNASPTALRCESSTVLPCESTRDAERPELRSHAERGNDIEADLRYVCRILAGVLKVPPEAVQPDRFLEEYGVDSLVTQQIVSVFAADLGNLPATLVYEYPSARKLAVYLRDRCGAQLDQQHQRHQPADPFARAQEPATAPTPHATEPRATSNGPLDIAIVGLAGRYPLADDLEQFWENLSSGTDCIGEVPAERWDWRPYFDPDPEAPGKTYTAQGGFLRDADRFDARFFRISPREADDMDPQERLFLETAWHCVEQAGYDPLALGKNQAVGVFVGVMNANYSQLAAEAWRPGLRTGARTAYWSIANRVSFCLDYRGPSLAVDSACSSSLTAIHLACHSLLRGECKLAIAGGVNLILHPAHLVCLADLHMLSPGGRCRSFGAGADGFVDGEGVGAVLLKPLAQALADGDAVWGVIKGSALNSGGRTTGYTVPSPEAQGRLVAAAVAQSGIAPADIGYIEAHGTGTALGDPIELAGLRAAFGAAATAPALGSVKSNIGHAEAAAGIAGLSKVLLQLRHGVVAPSLHAEPLNPKLELGSFRVVARREAWPSPAGNRPRAAGLSSFGAGGANAHLVVQEIPSAPRGAPPLPGPFLLPFSARDAAALERLLRGYREWLSRREDDPYWLQDVAFTLQRGRTPMAERVAVVADSAAALDAALSAVLEGRPVAGVYRRESDKTIEGCAEARSASLATDAVPSSPHPTTLAALAQRWTSGADVDWTPLWTGGEVRRRSLPLYPFARTRHWLKANRANTVARMEFNAPVSSSASLGPLLPAASLADGLYFALGISPESPLLTQHQVAGRAVLPGVAGLILGLAAWEKLFPGRACDIADVQWLQPVVLESEVRLRLAQDGDGLRFELIRDGACHVRGLCLEQPHRSHAPRGNASPDALRPVLLRTAERGNDAEHWRDGAEIYAALRKLGIEHGPFYQVVTRYAGSEREALAELALSKEQCLPGETWQPALLDGALQTIAGIAGLERQSLLPFRLGRAFFFSPPGERAWCHAERLEGWRFRVTLYTTAGQTAACFEDLEARPLALAGPVPAGLAGSQAPAWEPGPGSSSFPASATARASSGKPELPLPHSQASAWERAGDEEPIETDPLAGLFYVPQWSRLDPAECPSAEPLAALAVFGAFSAGSQAPAWEPGPASSGLPNFGKLELPIPRSQASAWERAEPAERAERAEKVLLVATGPAEPPADVLRLADTAAWTAALADLPDPLQLVFLAPEQNAGLDADGGCLELLALLKGLAEAPLAGRKLRLLILTRQAIALRPDDSVCNPHAAALHGLALAAARELPQLSITCIDEDGSTSTFPELPITLSPVAIRAGQAYRRRLEPVCLPEAPSPYRQGGVYLIVGGAGGLGLALAEDLARRYQAQVFLTGRGALDENRRQAIAALGGASNGTQQPAGGALSMPSPQPSPRGRGGFAVPPAGCWVGEGRVRYLRADATDLQAMTRAIAEVEAEAGPLHGVFHCALVLADRALRQMDEATFLAALAPKQRAALVLAQCLGDIKLDFLAFFSSAQSFLGNAGQANYTAGCSFVDAWAAYLAQHRPYPVRVLNWGFWGETGAVASPEYTRRLKAQGILPIATQEGLAATERALAAPLLQIVPFRAESRFLAQAGIGQGPGLVARRPDYPAILPEIEAVPADAPALVNIAAGMQRLDRAAAEWFCLGLIEAGWIAPGSMQAEDGLPHRLPSRFHPLFRAALPLLERYGLLQRTDDGQWRWGAATPPDLDAIEQDCPELAAYVDLLRALVPAYAAILQGERAPTDLLFPEGSAERVAGIYQGHALADGLNRMAAAAVVRFVERCPATRLRILELGAGSGATAQVLLAALQPHAGRVSYVFSDLAPAFVKQAREALAERYPYARFEVRDINRTPEELGQAQYDIVVAANVLHATPDLRATLDHVRMLLKPNGLLLLNEVTENSPYATFTFGLLDGWWAFRDGLRLPGGPLLDRAGWRRVLAEQGFYGYAEGGFDGLGQHLMLANCGVLAPAGSQAPSGSHAPSGSQAPAWEPGPGSSSFPASATARASSGKPELPLPRSQAGAWERAESVERLIVTAMAETLEIDPEELNVDMPHAEFGLDSILGVEVVSRVNRLGGFELSATDLFNYPTIRELAGYIVASRGLNQPSAGSQAPAWEPDPGSSSFPEPGSSRASRSIECALHTSHSISESAIPQTENGKLELPLPRSQAGAWERAESASRRQDARTSGQIAVIGMACNFPGAPNLDAFWQLLKEGRDAVRPIPPERWSLARWYDPDPKQPGKTYSQWAGWLDGYDRFDPAFFNISPREAELMDPQQRQFLMVAWHALEHAGYGDKSLARQRCGIVAGAGAGDYRNRLAADAFEADGAYAFMGNSDAILAGRLAYFLDLKGPCLTLDTACSSSLVAVHLARESLLRGETDMVLAGGVTIQTTAQFHVLSAKAGMLSPTGRCRPFDAEADGIVPAEGVALVVLKRLEDALADGDHIHAVIAGSGVNQDGRSNGITAPNALSQTDLIGEVYRRHGIDPEQIGYVEAHGTGTRLGDPIEVEALAAAFRRYTARQDYCGLGSVKSNIGHALAAAGVAGLIKAILCLEHRTWVPSLHFRNLNPHIRLAGSPFRICRTAEDWPAPPGGVRHAAVSAFGFSGTNAHLVLREAPVVEETVTSGRARLPLALSAQTRTALRKRAQELAAWLREHPEARLEDLAATLWLGRAHLPYRLAVAASSAAEFRLWLEQPDLESLIRRCKPGAEPPVPLPAEAEDAVARLAAVRPTASDPDTVVRAYLEGWPLSWPALFEGVAFRRLVLPLYPFDTASYVVPSRDAIEGCAEARSASLAIHAALHPLIDRNTSTLEVQRFAWRPDPAADFLDQHRLGGQPVLPAVAFLEQARMAGVLSLPEPPNLIRGLELLQVLACRERPEVQILLAPDGAAARFEIVSEAETGQPRLHARGGLSHAGLPPVPPVPVEKLWEQAGEKQSGEACYAAIRRLGIAHGPAYRLLAETARSGRRVLARFSAGSQAPAWEPGLGSSSFPEPATARASDGKQELPPPHSQAGAWERGEGERGGTGERAADGWLIHPYLTDALLQAAAVYFTGLPQEDAAVAWLPALIETARIHAPGAAACWGVLTHVHGDPAQEDSVRFDASLLDGAGQTLLALEGVVFKRALPRAVPAVATARPAPAMDDMRERLAADVLAQVAAVLKVAPEDVDPDDDLSSYGFDSIGFTALASKLETLLGFALSPSVFFEHRTLAAFLDYLLGSQEQQLRRHYGIDHSHGLRSPLYTSPDDSPRCQNGGTPEGFKAISRGLSVATPPVDGPIKTPTTPEGSQKSGHNADCCDPSGVERIISLSNPGVSLTLNPRLMAGNPPGCKTEATTHMRIKRGAERGNDVQEPIAIVGLAGSMPGCRDLDEFWQKLLAVESMVREIPPERWDWQAIFGDPAGERNKCNIRYGAFLDGVDRFDPLFFGISPREAEAMDPQQRLFLETVWHAVENAGYRASALAGRKIGVFAGVANFDYNELWRARSGDINAHAATGTAHSIVPNRVSFLLDFKGPSEPVDTACSSGLVAVYRAMAAIRDGSCEMAVAGAVNVMLTPTLHIAFNKAGMLSQDGQCRTFDRDAAGYVRGEGVGAVLLKPLSKAEADGDTIHGVLLGGALYHGGHANSLTAPNPASQAELLVEAYRRAGVAVDRVSYVEAHGTGTRLGDPAEVSGLANAFARLREQQGGRLLPESCGLGSVKTNIGHLETAAGIAGLLKILLAMRHGQLPGNAHFRVQNPYIDLGNSPFYILRESRPWRPRDAGGQLIPRIAGISSFGFGGAYAHLVVQEGPGRPPAADTGREELFVFSARDPERLRALAQSWLDFARRQGNGVRLADAAHTARVGREAYACRLACLCGQWPTLAEALAAFLAGESHPALLEPNPDRSHAPRGNAAPDALRPVPTRTAERWEARSHAERGNDVELRDLAADWLAGGQPDWQAIAPASARRVPIPGYPFARESYWPPLEAPPADGALHPLAGANRATLYSQKYAARLEPGFALLRDHQVAGHGILPATAYLEWARAAGSLAAEQPIAVLADIVWQRPLLAGAKPVGIQALLEPQGDGVRFELCSGPDEAPLLHAQGWLSLETPEPPQDSLDLAAARSRLPVPWSEERCYGFFAELGLNYGPGFRVLREVAFNEREALGRLQPAVADPAYEWQPALLDGLLQTGAVLMAGYGEKGLLLPHALARFSVFRPLAAGGWVHVRLLGEPGPEGAALNLDYYDEAGNLLARMEGLEVRPVAAAPVRPPQPVEAGPVALAFRRCWEEISGVADARAPGTILVFDREGALFRALADAGADCRRVESVDDLAPAPASQPPGRLLAYFPASSPPAETLRTCAALLRGLGSTLARRRIPLLLAYGYAPSTPPPGLDGFARSAMQEYGGLRIRVLGLAGDPAGHAQEIVAELGRDDFHVRLDGSRRVAVLRSVELPEQAADLTGTTWLITGAGGALGRLMAEALAARGCRLALTGRRAPDEALHAFLATQEDRACYHACDLADADAVAQLVAETRRRFGPIHGLIHAAGVTADALIARKTAEQMEAVLAGKLEAAYRLDACLADAADLRWFVLFGSLAGVTGNIGQADYAYANAGLAHFAAWREAQRAEGRRHGLSLCLEWPYWRDGGMRLDERTLAFMEKQTGLAPLPTAIGLELFFRSLALEGGAVGFAYGGIHRSHALRGNAAWDALRPVLDRTAEQWDEHSHAESGNDAEISRRVGTAHQSGLRYEPVRDAERPGLRSHAERGNDLEALIEDRLLDLASAILKIDKAQFDPEDPMDAYGFDSINLNALAHELGEQYGITLQPATFFEYPTLRAYAAYLAREHRAAIAAKLLPDAAPETPSAVLQPAAPALEPTPRRRAFRLGSNAAPEPIAVVGLSAILPGADDLGEFWAALESGLDLVSEIPPSRWDWRLWHGSPAEGKTPVKRAGFMKRVDGFDAAFFGISPKEAALMDPQHRLFLQAAWHAIEDAGHKPSDFQGRKVGLFVGVSSFDYQEILRTAPDGVHAHELTGNAHSILANRVSYWLNLRGPSEPVDTACSSSLVAVHRAIRAIRAGECEMALAGGVNVLLSPLVQLAFAKAGMLSPDGRCKTFDAAADGYVRGEGVGALLLKPLSLAQRDGNPIDALILGSAVNHGGRAHHLVAPNPKAQAEVVAAAVADAGVDPRSIGYIEVHGTGTALGDPIEINGLKLAFGEMLGQAQTKTPFCALGSVKTQIGHLEAAAGVAGLAKLLLCFRHGRLPGNRQLQALNPQIQLQNSPFYLPKDAEDWQRRAIDDRVQPRRAGISSFGFGGVNAHLVLEEAPRPLGEGLGVRAFAGSQVPAFAGSQAPAWEPGLGSSSFPEPATARASDGKPELPLPHSQAGAWERAERADALVFPFSAKDETRLRAVVDAFLALDPLPDLPGMAYTLQIGREAMPQRLAVIADSPAELRRKLQGYRDGLADPDVLPGNPADAGLLSSLLDEEEGENFVATLFKTGKLRKLARFWAAGLEVDWTRAYPDAKPARVHLPGYPFAETRYWAVEESPWSGEQEFSRRVGTAHQNDPLPASASQRWAVPTLHDAPATADSPVAGFLRERLAQVAGFDPATLDPQADLNELGLDSILAMELLRDIEAAYGLRLFPSELVEHNSLAALAAHIERELGSAPSNYVELSHRGSSPRQGERSEGSPGSMAMDGAQTRPVTSLSLDFGSAAAAVGIPCRNDGFEAPLNSITLSPSPGSRTPTLPGMVFLLSTPRAGSTLLRAMLMGHSRLFAPPELHLLPFADLAERRRVFEQEGKSFLGEGLLQALCALDGLSPEAAKDQVARWIDDAMPVAAVYGHLQERLGPRILVDKSPSYAQSLEVLQRAERLQPAPRYIQLIRHPLAVADSFVRNRFHRLLGAEDAPWPLALRLWDEYNGHLDAFLAKLPPERVFRLHFEDLVAAPEAATRALCGWLGVDFEPALLDPYRGERLTQGLHAQSLPIGDPNFHRHERIEPELAAAPAEAWEQLALLDSKALAHALRWGYCLDGEPVPLAPAQAAFLAGREQPAEELLIYRAAWPEAEVDEAALAWAWRRVLRRHLALRHAFFLENGVWRQQPKPESEPVFAVMEEDGDSAAQLVEALRREFDSQAGRLAGCGLARRGDGSATVVLMVHHLVADGVSLAMLGRDLLAAYRQPYRDLPAVDDRFRRYAELVQQAPLPLADLPAWQRHIATPCRLPTDGDGPHPAGQETSSAGSADSAGSQAPAWEPGPASSSLPSVGKQELPLPHSQAGAWERAERAGTRDAERGNDLELSLSPAELGLVTATAETRHRRLLAALLQTLAEWTGQPVPVIALRRHGRSGPLAEPFHGVVGWFACDIPLAVAVAADFEQTLAGLPARLAELPADEAGYLRLQLAGELPPLYQVAPLRFNYQPAGLAGIAGEIERRVTEADAPRDYLIDWIVRERGDRLEIVVRHDRTLHRPDTIAGLVERWRAHIGASPIA